MTRISGFRVIVNDYPGYLEVMKFGNSVQGTPTEKMGNSEVGKFGSWEIRKLGT